MAYSSTKVALRFIATFGLASCSYSAAAADEEAAASSSLSAFTTEEIVAEYHARLDYILEEQMKSLDDKMNEWIERNNAALLGQSPPLDEETIQQYQAFRNIYKLGAQDLIPFALAGDYEAEGALGRSAMAGYLGRSIACDGVRLSFSAAQKGNPASAWHLAMIYSMGPEAMGVGYSNRGTFHSEQTKKKSYLWLLEALHRLPQRIDDLNSFFPELSEEELTAFDEEWRVWSPMSANVDDLLKHVCFFVGESVSHKDIETVDFGNEEVDMVRQFLMDLELAVDLAHFPTTPRMTEKELKRLAEADDAEAQYNLYKHLYSYENLDLREDRFTKNTERDICAAVHWISRAARQGYPQALASMSLFHQDNFSFKHGPNRELETLYLWAWANVRGFERKNYINMSKSPPLSETQFETWSRKFESWNISTDISYEPKSCPSCEENCITPVQK